MSTDITVRTTQNARIEREGTRGRAGARGRDRAKASPMRVHRSPSARLALCLEHRRLRSSNGTSDGGMRVQPQHCRIFGSNWPAQDLTSPGLACCCPHTRHTSVLARHPTLSMSETDLGDILRSHGVARVLLPTYSASDLGNGTKPFEIKRPENRSESCPWSRKVGLPGFFRA